MYDSNSTISINNGNNVTWGEITGATVSSNYDNYRIIVTSPTGTETTVTAAPHQTDKRISPGLYFKFVKSKLQKNELEQLKIRLKKLQALTQEAFDLGQDALYEDFAKSLAITVRESEALACGYGTWVSIKDIEKFKTIVKEDGGDKNPVYFKKLEEFPRPIPYVPAKIIKEVKEKQLFDLLWVLYLDYVGVELKTNKQKIREKDPILFGQFAYAKDRYYFICDWTDKHCDLTLQEFISKIRTQDSDYMIHDTPEMDQEFIKRIKSEVLARQQRLDGTKSSNYKDLMKKEDLEKLKAEIRAEEKKPWWKKIF
jgi:hypothetical protein